MNPEVFEIAFAVLTSIGGGAVLIFALSSWLGKIWAQRILQSDKAAHDEELSRYKAQLQEMSQKKSLNHQEKIELYKVVSNPMVDLASALGQNENITMEHIHKFDHQRLFITSQLALFAPVSVFTAYNDMVDYIYDSIEGGTYTFEVFREKSFSLLSEIRKDIGIYNDSIFYNGSR